MAAALAVQLPGMGAAAFDNPPPQPQQQQQSHPHSSSLASRRQGASVLPGFELPHPNPNPQTSALFPGHVLSAAPLSSSSPSAPGPGPAPPSASAAAPSASPSQKYPLPSNTTPPQASSTTNVRVPSLLTPTSNHPSDGSSSFSGLSPFPLDSNQFPPYSQGYWPGSPSYAFNSGMHALLPFLLAACLSAVLC